jgi:hypothetical protein
MMMVTTMMIMRVERILKKVNTPHVYRAILLLPLLEGRDPGVYKMNPGREMSWKKKKMKIRRFVAVDNLRNFIPLVEE